MIGSECRECCACEPTYAQFFLLPSQPGSPGGQNAVVFEPDGFGGSQSRAITSTFGEPVISLDVLHTFGVWPAGATPLLQPARPIATDASIAIPLWCDSKGENAAATLTLQVQQAVFMEEQYASTQVVPVKGASLPASHIVAFGLNGDNPPEPLKWQYAEVTVTVRLETSAGVSHDAVFRTLPAGDYWGGGLVSGIGMQACAVFMDGELNVNVRVFAQAYQQSAFGFSGDYSESKFLFLTGLTNNLGADSVGLSFSAGGRTFPLWHIFDTVKLAPQHYHAGVEVESLGTLPNGGTQPTVRAYGRLFPVRATHVAAIPAKESVFCDPSANGYIDPDATAENLLVTPEKPNNYPWFKTPCTRWIKGGRITNAKNLSAQAVKLVIPPVVWIENLNTRYGSEDLRDTLGGTYELYADADNTFWYSDGGLQLSARISVATGEPFPGSVDYRSLPPCPNSNWLVKLFVDITYLGLDEQTDGMYVLCGRFGLEADAGVLRGDEAVCEWGNAPTSLPFRVNGWLKRWGGLEPADVGMVFLDGSNQDTLHRFKFSLL